MEFKNSWIDDINCMGFNSPENREDLISTVNDIYSDFISKLADIAGDDLEHPGGEYDLYVIYEELSENKIEAVNKLWEECESDVDDAIEEAEDRDSEEEEGDEE